MAVLKKKKTTTASLLVPCNQMNRFSHHAVTAFYFTLKALFLTTKCYFHHVLYVLMLYVFICSIYLFGERFYIPFRNFNLMPKCSL